jgi:copper chaperone
MTIRRFSLTIDGMHCGGCVRRVQKALDDLDGVAVEKIEVGSAAGTFESDVLDAQTLVQAIDKLGFQARTANVVG